MNEQVKEMLAKMTNKQVREFLFAFINEAKELGALDVTDDELLNALEIDLYDTKAFGNVLTRVCGEEPERVVGLLLDNHGGERLWQMIREDEGSDIDYEDDRRDAIREAEFLRAMKKRGE